MKMTKVQVNKWCANKFVINDPHCHSETFFLMTNDDCLSWWFFLLSLAPHSSWYFGWTICFLDIFSRDKGKKKAKKTTFSRCAKWRYSLDHLCNLLHAHTYTKWINLMPACDVTWTQTQMHTHKHRDTGTQNTTQRHRQRRTQTQNLLKVLFRDWCRSAGDFYT